MILDVLDTTRSKRNLFQDTVTTGLNFNLDLQTVFKIEHRLIRTKNTTFIETPHYLRKKSELKTYQWLPKDRSLDARAEENFQPPPVTLSGFLNRRRGSATGLLKNRRHLASFLDLLFAQ